MGICGATANVQALQSGDSGFGWQWVRSHQFGIQAVSLRPATWDFDEYFGAGMTLLNRDPGNPFTTNRPPAYADKQWHAFVTDQSLYNTMKSIPGNTGWIINDEPSRLQMPAVASLTSYVRQQDPQKVLYTAAAHDEWGAAGWYGDSSQPGYTYAQYLDDFVSIIHPDVLVFDKYSLYSDGTTNAFYLRNLMTIRSKAISSNLPYWGWLQAFGRSQGREPSESDNRFNAYTHLTMGYTGFLYWTYDYYAGTGDAMIDINGNQMPLYQSVKQTSAETTNLGKSLRYLKSTDVRFVPGKHGSPAVTNSTPAGLTNWGVGPNPDPHILSLTVDFTNSANIGTGKDGLVGFFTDDAQQPYFMLSNLYHGASLSAAAASLGFAITFDSSVNELLRLNRVTGAQEVLTLNNHQLFWTLPGGTGDLFKYNTGDFVGGIGWSIGSSGDWTVASNWAGGIPNAVGAAAVFGPVISSPQVVYTNTAVTVGSLKFDSAARYQLAGTGSLTIDVASGSGSISVLKGSHKINLPMRLNDNTTADVAAGATLLIADPLTLAAGTTLTKTGSGSLLIEAPVRTAGAAALNVAEGTAELNDPAGTPATGAAPASALLSIAVSGSKLSLGGSQVLRGLDAVTSNSGDQQIDLGGHAVRVYPADPATEELGIYSDIKSALLSASGQDGIYDSTKPAGSYALGVTDQSYDAHGDASVLVKLTRLGDANVDGIVDISDLGKLASGWQSLGLWDNGDFNYDGFIDISDLGLLASNWGQSNAGLSQALSSLGLPGVSVPEPSTVGLLLVGFVLAATRRSCHVTKTR